MSALIARGLFRYAPSVLRWMARNPGLGGRMIRYGKAAVRGASAGSAAYASAKAMFNGKRRGRSFSPSKPKRYKQGNISKFLNQPKYVHPRSKIMRARNVDKSRYVTKGQYVGKFKTPTKTSGRKLLPYNKQGLVFVKELTGTVSDPDVVYIVNAVINSYDVITAVVGAALRILFEKAGIRITGFSDDIAPANMAVSRGEMTVRLLTMNKYSNAVVTYDEIVSAGTSLSTLVTAFFNPFILWASGFDNSSGAGTAGNLVEPQKFILYANQDADTSIQTQMSEINFDECEVSLHGSAQMKVQNRTKSATGSGDEQDVSNNPLQGRLYHFKGVPRPKNNVLSNSSTAQMAAFSALPVDVGVKTLVGATDFGTTDFKEPQPPTAFFNCTRSSFVRLEPGAIKQYDVKYDSVHAMPHLFKMLRVQYGINTSEYSTNYTIFPVQMIGLEDVINVNLLENISIAYEIERILAVKVSAKAKKFCRTSFKQVTVTT